MGSPFDTKAKVSQSDLQSVTDPSQDYCGLDNLPEEMNFSEEIPASFTPLETANSCSPSASFHLQSFQPLLNPTSILFYGDSSSSAPSSTHPPSEPGEKVEPSSTAIHPPLFNFPFFAALSGKVSNLRAKLSDSPQLLKPYTDPSHLRDPDQGVTFDTGFTSLQPAGNSGGVLSDPSKKEKVTKHEIIFTDVRGHLISSPGYIKERTYYGITYTNQDGKSDFLYFDSYGIRGATPIQPHRSNVDLIATAKIIPERDANYNIYAFLPHPTGYQVVDAYVVTKDSFTGSENSRSLDLFRTQTGDYFVKTDSTEEMELRWNLKKETVDHFNWLHNTIQFQNQVKVDWHSVDLNLPILAQNAYYKEGMQLLLDYIATKTSYGWSNFSQATKQKDLVEDLLKQSNCAAINLLMAGLLSQQGIQVRFIGGYTAEGISHAWLEVKMKDKLTSFEHWEIVDFTAKIRNGSGRGHDPLPVRSASRDDMTVLSLPKVMRGNEIKPIDSKDPQRD